MKKGDLVITCPGEEWAAAAKTRALTEEQKALFEHVGFSRNMFPLFGKRGVVTALILTGDEDKRIHVTHFEPDDDEVHRYFWPPELVKVVKEYHPDDEDNPY